MASSRASSILSCSGPDGPDGLGAPGAGRSWLVAPPALAEGGFENRRAHLLWHAVVALQLDQLVEGERPPLARPQVFAGHSGVGDARQAHYRKACGFAELAHLAVAPFTQGDFEPSLVAFEAQPLDLRGLGGSAIDHDSLAEAFESRVVNGTLHFRDVHLRHGLLGMRERLSKLAIVGA